MSLFNGLTLQVNFIATHSKEPINDLAQALADSEAERGKPLLEVYEDYKKGMGITSGRMLEAIKKLAEGEK